MQHYNFYSYQLVRDIGSGTDEWRSYVIKARNDEHCQQLAELHADTLNKVLEENLHASRYFWQVYLVRRFNMSLINQGLPVRTGSYNIPSGSRIEVNNL
jgi:hypothetical protein